MALAVAKKNELVQRYKRSERDTGSPEVQIALLTANINALTEHLKIHKHDFHTRYGLTKMVSRRKRLLRYLRAKNAERYQTIIKSLEIRG